MVTSAPTFPLTRAPGLGLIAFVAALAACANEPSEPIDGVSEVGQSLEIRDYAGSPVTVELSRGSHADGFGNALYRLVAEARVLEVTARPDSMVGRRPSIALRRSSGSSSRDSTPPWARVLSPGRTGEPPPISAASLHE